jgi:hypothetical protein
MANFITTAARTLNPTKKEFPNRFCNADHLQEVKQVDPEEDEKVAVMTNRVQDT